MPVPDFVSSLKPADAMTDRPLEGRRIGMVLETTGEGVDLAILETLNKTVMHMEHLGAEIQEANSIVHQSFLIFLALGFNQGF